jgi:YD repeat-containing protein
VPDLIQDESIELFEVDLRLGLLLDKHTDFYLPDVLPIAFERVTRDGWPADHPMGRSGTDSYDEFLCATDNALNGMQIVNADGGRTNFVRYPGWVPVKWLVKFVDQQDQFIALHKYPSEHFALKDISGGTHTYLNCPTSDVRCFFAGYRDALGRELKVDRDATRGLIRVTSPNGNWIHVKHGLKGRIEEIVDSRGRKIRYSYDEGNRLTAVIYPSGEMFRYVYDDTEHLLAFSIAADANSTPRLLLKNEYMHGLLVRQTIADNRVYEYAYEASASDQIQRATVHTPNGRTFRIDVTDAFSVIREGSLEDRANSFGKR